MSHNEDIIKLVKLVEGQHHFAGTAAGQKPGDQVRGTDKTTTKGTDHPFKGRLVGEETTLEDVLGKKYQDFKELQQKEKEQKQDEAANPAQQAAIAISMKKAGKKPKSEGVAEGSLNEFAPSGGGDGRWYTDDEIADIIGEDWFEFDLSGEAANISRHGEHAKILLVQEAQAYFEDRGYHGVTVQDVRDDEDFLSWYISGNFTRLGEGVAEGQDDNAVSNAIFRRLMITRPQIFSRYGDEFVANAVFHVANNVGQVEEIGTSDVSIWVREVLEILQRHSIDENLIRETIPPSPTMPRPGQPTTSIPPKPGQPTAGSISPDEQTALDAINKNPAMKQQFDKLIGQTQPGGTTQQMKLTPDQEDSLERLKTNAGLKTQYDRLLKQANPAMKS